uniref:Uncharacterized protein n=2 Tax=Oryza sativa subsp. japonica TaxID=39947 RepID=Q10GB7_ORYSJ|nr:hypothetical protein [Oryza sativa Japonica Group]ABF97785.1 hypothetical protein LOC_Os03g43550 [Oryza sativa Japonica Group]
MATSNKFTTKPHVFDGTDFSHWCSRMQSYIMAENYDIWRKVSHPYVIPEVINTAAAKTEFELNCKARNILLSGIPRSDYDRVAHLQTAHEIWIALSNFHQGTNNIKELRRDLFKKEYIKFEMKPGEALDDYLSRFNKILSDLRSVDSSYDANYPQSEISRHFLNGLDMSIWEMKVTSIQESVNMTTLTLDSLYTKLKTHEMNILSRTDEDEDKGKQVVDLAFIARNASSDVDESDDDNEEKLSYDQLELAAYKFAKKLQTSSIVLDEKDHTIDILNAEIDRLKSSIPNDDNCQSCEVLFSEINALRDVNSVNCKKLEFEIEKSKKLESSFTLGFALHARVVDELILTKNILKKNTKLLFVQEVSYLKSSLQRFSDGKKNLNMILDQSKLFHMLVFEVVVLVNTIGCDSMPRESICGDGPGVGLVVRRCPWWSDIMRDTKARVDAHG